MAFDPTHYKTSTRQQWQDYVLSPEDQRWVWVEIEEALGQFETDSGFVGPCELVIAGATR